MDVVAFALGELGVPTTSDFYDMTWADFQIKSFSWKRMQENRKREIREISFWAGLGYHKYTRPDQMYKVGDEVTSKRVTDAHKEAFKKDYQRYLEEAKKARMN